MLLPDPYDHDNDGILDHLDWDDDNDGILEGPLDSMRSRRSAMTY